MGGAAVFAANSRDAFVAQYPDLDKIPVDQWEFLMTIAGTGTALLTLGGRFSVEQQRDLTATVLESLVSWNQGGVEALKGFPDHVTGSVKQQDEVPEAIGGWIMVKGQQSDPLAAHVLGLMLINAFAGWWET